MPALAACWVMTWFSGWALAQLPQARLDSIFPCGGQPGQRFEVTLTGDDLDRASALIFSHPGIEAATKQPSPSVSNDSGPFAVSIAEEVPPGIYEVRARGYFGISNPRAFVVDPAPVARERSPNHAADHACPIALGEVIEGWTDSQAVDHFKILAPQGQRLILTCLAECLDSRLNPVLRVFDPRGREIARGRRGGLVDVTCPSEGSYLIQLHDVLYRGGRDYFYRLRVHGGPWIDFIDPPAGLPGVRSAFTLYGRGLPGSEPAADFAGGGAPLERVTVEIELPDAASFQSPLGRCPAALPSDGVVHATVWRWESSKGISNPVFIGLATAPVVKESEPNQPSDHAQRLELPCEVAGRFHPAQDADGFTFQAEQGKVYWLEVYSERLGLPTNPFLLLQRITRNDQGVASTSDIKELYFDEENPAGREFDTRHRDVAWRFEVKETGEYQLLARDLAAYADAPWGHAYRLSLRESAPDFELAARASQPLPVTKDARAVSPWEVFLRRGETWPIEVVAFRRDQFDGEILLSLEGLPPSVQCETGVIPAGQTKGFIFCTAPSDTEAWGGLVRVVGQSEVMGQTTRRAASGLTMTWKVGDYNNEGVRPRLAKDIALAVHAEERAPITVRPAEDKVWSAAANGSLEIPLMVERHGDYNETLKLKAFGSVAFEKLKELEIKKDDTNVTLAIPVGELKVGPGAYPLVLRSVTKGKYRNQPELIELAKERVRRAEESLAQASEALKQAEQSVQSFGEDSEQRKAAEQARSDAEQERQSAEAAKNEASEQVKAAEEKAKPKDVNFTVYSMPIRIQITPVDEGKVAQK